MRGGSLHSFVMNKRFTETGTGESLTLKLAPERILQYNPLKSDEYGRRIFMEIFADIHGFTTNTEI